jgi:hypothetical protein
MNTDFLCPRPHPDTVWSTNPLLNSGGAEKEDEGVGNVDEMEVEDTHWDGRH